MNKNAYLKTLTIVCVLILAVTGIWNLTGRAGARAEQ